jgi:hypothetical protein
MQRCRSLADDLLFGRSSSGFAERRVHHQQRHEVAAR